MVVLFLEVKKIKISVYVCLMFIPKKTKTKTKTKPPKKNEKKKTKTGRWTKSLIVLHVYGFGHSQESGEFYM